jgi:hypothetical protein
VGGGHNLIKSGDLPRFSVLGRLRL